MALLADETPTTAKQLHQKIVLYLASLIITLVVAWMALTLYFGYQIQKQCDRLVVAMQQQSSLVEIYAYRFRRQWFASTLKFKLVMRSPLPNNADLKLNLEGNIAHGPIIMDWLRCKLATALCTVNLYYLDTKTEFRTAYLGQLQFKQLLNGRFKIISWPRNNQVILPQGRLDWSNLELAIGWPATHNATMPATLATTKTKTPTIPAILPTLPLLPRATPPSRLRITLDQLDVANKLRAWQLSGLNLELTKQPNGAVANTVKIHSLQTFKHQPKPPQISSFSPQQQQQPPSSPSTVKLPPASQISPQYHLSSYQLRWQLQNLELAYTTMFNPNHRLLQQNWQLKLARLRWREHWDFNRLEIKMRILHTKEHETTYNNEGNYTPGANLNNNYDGNIKDLIEIQSAHLETPWGPVNFKTRALRLDNELPIELKWLQLLDWQLDSELTINSTLVLLLLEHAPHFTASLWGQELIKRMAALNIYPTIPNGAAIATTVAISNINSPSPEQSIKEQALQIPAPQEQSAPQVQPVSLAPSQQLRFKWHKDGYNWHWELQSINK